MHIFVYTNNTIFFSPGTPKKALLEGLPGGQVGHVILSLIFSLFFIKLCFKVIVLIRIKLIGWNHVVIPINTIN